MGLFDHLRPEQLRAASSVPGELAHGARVVTRVGTVSFVRGGFAQVRWDDESTSVEWVANLLVVVPERSDG